MFLKEVVSLNKINILSSFNINSLASHGFEVIQQDALPSWQKRYIIYSKNCTTALLMLPGYMMHQHV